MRIKGRLMTIAKRFLAFVETAPAPARAAATSLLAQAFVKGRVAETDAAMVEAALTAMLDDRSPMVRRALSTALAAYDCAPRHIIVALAGDEPTIAAPVLELSPLLTTAELVEVVTTGHQDVHMAVARRAGLAAPVAAALAEVVDAKTAIIMAANFSADILAFSLERLIERYPNLCELAVVMLARPALPRDIVMLAELVVARTAGDDDRLAPSFGDEGGYQDRKDTIILRIGTECSPGELAPYVAALRRHGLLTSALILRGLMLGHSQFVAAVFAELSGQSIEKAKGLIAEGRGGFSALFARAGLPQSLLEIFRLVLKERGFIDSRMQVLDRDMLRTIMLACIARGVTEADAIVPMLRRLDLAMAREEARALRRQVIADAFLDEPMMLRPSLHENGRVEILARQIAENAALEIQHHLTGATTEINPTFEPDLVDSVGEGGKAGAGIVHLMKDAEPAEQPAIKPETDAAATTPSPECDLDQHRLVA
jgi:uncharacterized protein (DUF2336 family)